MTGNPRRGNPMSAELGKAILDALADAMADDGILSVVLAGTATHFCVGADLVDVAKLSAVEAVLSGWLEDLDTIRRMTKPVIAAVRGRSEEHTSELQSLMRISYAVFCLK